MAERKGGMTGLLQQLLRTQQRMQSQADKHRIERTIRWEMWLYTHALPSCNYSLQLRELREGGVLVSAHHRIP